MARFCTKCGTPTEENQKFCNKCGAPVSAPEVFPRSGPSPFDKPAAPTPAPEPQPLVTPAQTTPQVTPVATPPPTKSGSSALKIIVAVVAALAFISVLAIGSCFYVGYKIKQKAQSLEQSARGRSGGPGTPELHLSEGGAGSKAAAAATVDVPPYPGSTPTESGGELSAGASGGASAQEYETPDSVDKVIAFYKEKFGNKITIAESGGNSTFFYLTSMGMTTVTLTRDEGAGKTKINIARIGK